MSRSHKSNFSDDELLHYSRQMAMPQFGEAGQQKLKRAKIAVIGAGGLGAPVLQYLAAAGVGTIGIFDFDMVEKSNLHRQVLFSTEDIGKSKAVVALQRLKKLNPHINVVPNQTRITPENVVEKLNPYDIVVDGSDNFQTRYIVNDACLILDIPLVYGSIYRFEGQVTAFNYVDNDENRGPNLRDLYPEEPDTGFIPDCSTAGVLGVLPGVIGSIQATEAIKIATGIGEVLSGKILLMDLLNMDTQLLTFSSPNPNRTADQTAAEERLRNYATNRNDIQQISPKELSEMMETSEDFNLIDVRTAEEHQDYNIGGRLIPLDEIEKQTDKISQNGKTVVYCQSGQRSARAIQILNERLDARIFYNLEGGIDAWMEMELGREGKSERF